MSENLWTLSSAYDSAYYDEHRGRNITKLTNKDASCGRLDVYTIKNPTTVYGRIELELIPSPGRPERIKMVKPITYPVTINEICRLAELETISFMQDLASRLNTLTMAMIVEHRPDNEGLDYLKDTADTM